MLISPTEPPALVAAGTSSLVPERYGVDILFAANGSFSGVQRKEFKDLLASITDGRLTEQTSRMQNLTHAMVVIEGMGRFTDDGVLVSKYHSRITRDQIRGLLWSVRARGIWVDTTSNLSDTISLVQAFERWCKKSSHTSLITRPGVQSEWGKADHRDYQLHLLQGLPGVGVELAGRIIDTLGMPFGWTVTEEELMSVDGIGKKKAATMLGALA